MLEFSFSRHLALPLRGQQDKATLGATRRQDGGVVVLVWTVVDNTPSKMT